MMMMMMKSFTARVFTSLGIASLLLGHFLTNAAHIRGGDRRLATAEDETVTCRLQSSHTIYESENGSRVSEEEVFCSPVAMGNKKDSIYTYIIYNFPPGLASKYRSEIDQSSLVVEIAPARLVQSGDFYVSWTENPSSITVLVNTWASLSQTTGTRAFTPRPDAVSATRNRTLAIVMISTLDETLPYNAATVMNTYFGNGTSVSLQSQYAACSWNQLVWKFRGIYQVQLNATAAQVHSGSGARNRAQGALFDRGLYRNSIDELADNIIFCVPRLPRGFIANASGRMSTYSLDWALHIQTVMHELAHNLLLNHAWEDRAASRGDSTTVMNPFATSQVSLCFNGAESHTLQWYHARERQFDPVTEGIRKEPLVSVVETDDPLSTPVLFSIWEQFFVTLQHAESFTADTAYSGSVIVTETEGGTQMRAALSLGESVELTYEDKTILIEVCAFEGNAAYVGFGLPEYSACSLELGEILVVTPSPTGAPTELPLTPPLRPIGSCGECADQGFSWQLETCLPADCPVPNTSCCTTRECCAAKNNLPSASPTVRPNTTPPTQSPTSTPTVSPSKDPTESPTSTPTLSPSKERTHLPSASPTPLRSLPTKSPSVAPSKLPTEFPTPLPSSPTIAPSIFPTPLFSSLPSNGPTTAPSIGVYTDVHRINAGSNEDVVVDGVTWQADIGSVDGETFQRSNLPILNASDPTIYRTVRFNEGDVRYSFDLSSYASESFRVRLHFAEIFFREPPGRVFDIVVNGQQIEDYDILADVGAGVAVVKEFIVPRDALVGGFVWINLQQKIENPAINAIEIAMLNASPTATPSQQTSMPTVAPTSVPSRSPSKLPTLSPSKHPTSSPSDDPSAVPSLFPSESPSVIPSDQPSDIPSGVPIASQSPSATPSDPAPTDSPTLLPTTIWVIDFWWG